MRIKSFLPIICLVLFIFIVSIACSVGGAKTTEAPQATSQEVKTAAPVEVLPAEATQASQTESSGAVTSLENLKDAVIQIESQGTVVNPDFSVSYNNAGRGRVSSSTRRGWLLQTTML